MKRKRLLTAIILLGLFVLTGISIYIGVQVQLDTSTEDADAATFTTGVLCGSQCTVTWNDPSTWSYSCTGPASAQFTVTGHQCATPNQTSCSFGNPEHREILRIPYPAPRAATVRLQNTGGWQGSCGTTQFDIGVQNGACSGVIFGQVGSYTNTCGTGGGGTTGGGGGQTCQCGTSSLTADCSGTIRTSNTCGDEFCASNGVIHTCDRSDGHWTPTGRTCNCPTEPTLSCPPASSYTSEGASYTVNGQTNNLSITPTQVIDRSVLENSSSSNITFSCNGLIGGNGFRDYIYVYGRTATGSSLIGQDTQTNGSSLSVTLPVSMVLQYESFQINCSEQNPDNNNNQCAGGIYNLNVVEGGPQCPLIDLQYINPSDGARDNTSQIQAYFNSTIAGGSVTYPFNLDIICPNSNNTRYETSLFYREPDGSSTLNTFPNSYFGNVFPRFTVFIREPGQYEFECRSNTDSTCVAPSSITLPDEPQQQQCPTNINPQIRLTGGSYADASTAIASINSQIQNNSLTYPFSIDAQCGQSLSTQVTQTSDPSGVFAAGGTVSNYQITEPGSLRILCRFGTQQTSESVCEDNSYTLNAEPVPQCPATVTPQLRLVGGSYANADTAMTNIRSQITNGTLTYPFSIDAQCGQSLSTQVTQTSDPSGVFAAGGTVSNYQITGPGSLRILCRFGTQQTSASVCEDRSFSLNAEPDPTVTCYRCTAATNDGNACENSTFTGTCPSGWSTNSNCAQAAGGSCSAQVTCFRCTSSLLDGNNCESNVFNQSTCPSGWTTNSNCEVAAPGGVCPVQTTCYQCTAALNDGNACDTQVFSSPTCPTGWTSNSNCQVAAPGGVCPAAAPNIVKTSNLVTVNANEATIDYTITFRDTLASYDDLIINDILDTQVLSPSWISGTSPSTSDIVGSGGGNPVRIRWTDLNYTVNDNLVLTYTLTVPRAYYGVYDNVVTAYDDRDNDNNPDSNEALDNDNAQEVIPIPNPQITKTAVEVSLTSVEAVYDYTVQFTAVGSVGYDDLIVQDVLDTKVQPGWVSLISAGGNLTGAGGMGDPVTITWPAQSVTAGNSINFTYRVTIPVANYGVYDNIVSAYDDNLITDNDIPEAGEFLVDDDERVTQPTPNPVIIKDVSVGTPTTVEAVASYDIQFTANGIGYTDLIVQDVLDDQVQPGWVSNILPVGGVVTGAGGALDPVTITWTNLTVAAGGTLNFSYDLTVPAASYDQYDNIVTAYDDDLVTDNDVLDSGEELDTDDARFNLPPLNPGINKTGAVQSVDSNEAVIDYVVQFTASGISYTDAIIQDVLDTTVQPGWVSSISPVGGTVTGAGGVGDPVTITWIDQNIPDGNSIIYSYTLTVPRAFYEQYDNVVTAYDDLDDDDTPEGGEEIGTDNETITLPSPDPQITKSHTLVSVTGTEAIVDYTLQFTATGLGYSDLIIQDTLDTDVLPGWVSAVTPAGTITGAGGVSDPVVITWNGVSVQADQVISFTYRVTIPFANYGQYDNVVVAYEDVDDDDIPDPEEELDNDDDQVIITPPDPGLTKTSSVSVSDTEAVITYTINFNADSLAYEDLIIQDTLDEKVQPLWVSNINPSGTVTGAGGAGDPVTITWIDVAVNASETVSFTYNVTVPIANFGTYTNVVLSYDDRDDDDIPDPEEELDNDDETVTLTTDPLPELPNTAIFGDTNEFLLAGTVLVITAFAAVSVNRIAARQNIQFTFEHSSETTRRFEESIEKKTNKNRKK